MLAAYGVVGFTFDVVGSVENRKPVVPPFGYQVVTSDIFPAPAECKPIVSPLCGLVMALRGTKIENWLLSLRI